MLKASMSASLQHEGPRHLILLRTVNGNTAAMKLGCLHDQLIATLETSFFLSLTFLIIHLQHLTSSSFTTTDK
jgi:hypothetical protein